MSWYYNSLRGNVFEATGTQKWITDREVFASAHDPVPGQIFGPYPTEAAAEAQKTTHPAIAAAINPLNAVNTAATDIGQYLIRGAEIVLGIVLVAIAVNAIIRSTTGVNVAGAAGKAAAVAAV